MIKLPVPRIKCIKGWFEPNEQDLLETLAMTIEGPILELGPWVGLSTMTIINGMVKANNIHEFVTVDLFPTMDNFIIEGNQVWFKTGDQLLSSCSIFSFQNDIVPTLHCGVRNILERGLDVYGARKYVRIMEGNFHSLNIPTNYFHLVFADCCHNIKEFSFNFPRIRQFGNKNCLYAIHDMHYDTPDLQILSKIGSLAVCKIK